MSSVQSRWSRESKWMRRRRGSSVWCENDLFAAARARAVGAAVAYKKVYVSRSFIIHHEIKFLGKSTRDSPSLGGMKGGEGCQGGARETYSWRNRSIHIHPSYLLISDLFGERFVVRWLWSLSWCCCVDEECSRKRAKGLIYVPLPWSRGPLFDSLKPMRIDSLRSFCGFCVLCACFATMIKAAGSACGTIEGSDPPFKQRWRSYARIGKEDRWARVNKGLLGSPLWYFIFHQRVGDFIFCNWCYTNKTLPHQAI